ncbi:UTRA domain-containing protein [Nonomuraea phyllanthi]|uniref:UTRA domain-containing protein n=1 Tax=Nonomuraea phyllanthi TaxID=2219224 RepID=A0A5C4VXU7_9ACTN|nr:UTRA domain-containing protein [Nonomuraea phyllanthi]
MQPLTAGIGQHLRASKDLRLQHAVERLGARHPSADEAKLMKIRKATPVLGVLASVFNGGGRPVLVVNGLGAAWRPSRVRGLSSALLRMRHSWSALLRPVRPRLWALRGTPSCAPSASAPEGALARGRACHQSRVAINSSTSASANP